MKIESEGQDFSKLGMSFKKPKTTYRKEEKIIEHQVEGVLRQNGYYVQKMQSGVMRSFYNGKSYLTKMAASGTPDIMAFKVGELLFVEVKRPGHDATPLQKMKAELFYLLVTTLKPSKTMQKKCPAFKRYCGNVW